MSFIQKACRPGESKTKIIPSFSPNLSRPESPNSLSAGVSAISTRTFCPAKRMKLPSSFLSIKIKAARKKIATKTNRAEFINYLLSPFQPKSRPMESGVSLFLAIFTLPSWAINLTGEASRQ